MSRLTREKFCLMEGRHVHPSTLYPGGVSMYLGESNELGVRHSPTLGLNVE